MCMITEPSPNIWVVYERIPEEKRTDRDREFGIQWKRLPCGDFSSEAYAKLFLDNWKRSVDKPDNYEIEKHQLDYLLRCH